MDTIYLCCDFCRENYPNSTHIDWWYLNGETPWCNCYSNCNDYRCVSKDCWGYDGGDVETWELEKYTPPSPPLPPLPPPQPPCPPSPPPLPPAPPLEVNGSIVEISHDDYAAELLSEAILLEDVSIIYLYTSVSLSSRSLPQVNGSLSVYGLCDSDAGTSEGRCQVDAAGGEMFTLNGTLQLEGLELVNGAAVDGGALHLAPGSAVLLRDCVIRDCVAASFGGAIFLSASSSLELQSCQLLRNSAQWGGALYGEEGTRILVTNGTVLQSNAASDIGGGIYADGAFSLEGATETTVEVRGGSIFHENQARTFGGAISIRAGSLSVQESSLFTDNQAGSSGGALHDHGYGFNMIGAGVEISGNACRQIGGGFHIAGQSTAEIGPGSVFTNNSASLDGGAISVYTSSDLTVVSSIFTFNKALRKGGAIIGESETTSIYMFNTTLSGNVGEAGGGVFSMGKLVLEGCTLHGNSAHTTGGSCHATSSVVLRNTTVQENVAGTEGGGVFCAPTAEIVLDNATIVMSNYAALGGGCSLGSQGSMVVQGRTMIFNNSAQLAGGGLFVSANASILVTDQSEVTSNSAVMGNGGGIIGDVGSLIQVTGKVTVGSNVAGNSGGGMAYSTLRLLQSDVQGNVAMNLGGGIYGSSSAEVLNATIGSNTAAQGGGVYIKPVAESLTRPPFQLQEASIVENNEATAGEAGGIYVAYGVSLVVNRSHINGNKASSDAGRSPVLNLIYTWTSAHMDPTAGVVCVDTPWRPYRLLVGRGE
ncbi:hypothetical protein CYMTET_39019 [Cymbomonas tetramitiformis]|uniref:Uncharacterized protein n=1 Tax=Cymbomonas tetramitiformis TaxID=36881 RepID=A0AAE0F4X2_9CHLO|nr:hypothetical protein CYMTET_39019 [Cymbomonas tetramitiformis]